jgi:hypothetical protein
MTTTHNQTATPTTTSQPQYDGVTDLRPIKLYFVHGIAGEYFTTKLAAEVRARAAFPTENPDRRYARIFYRAVFEEVGGKEV